MAVPLYTHTPTWKWVIRELKSDPKYSIESDYIMLPEHFCRSAALNSQIEFNAYQ